MIGVVADLKKPRPARVGPWIGVLAVTVGAAWLGSVGLGVLGRAHDVGHAFAGARDTVAGPVIVAVVVALVAAERLWPAVPRPLLDRAHVVDAAYMALAAVVVVPGLTLVQTGFSEEIERHARFLILSRLPVTPQVLIVSAILVGMDAMNWASHLAAHRATALWRIHALHHSQEDMSVFTTFRTHPLMHVVYLPALLPALVLGSSGTLPATALIVYGCVVTLPHANLRWGFGPLGRVVVSPAYHRLHHSAAPVHGRPAVNFGFVLVVWDQLAGHAVFPVGKRSDRAGDDDRDRTAPGVSPPTPVPTGLAGRPVPIEQCATGAGIARVVVAQLAQPFLPRSAVDHDPALRPVTGARR